MNLLITLVHLNSEFISFESRKNIKTDDFVHLIILESHIGLFDVNYSVLYESYQNNNLVSIPFAGMFCSESLRVLLHERPSTILVTIRPFKTL